MHLERLTRILEIVGQKGTATVAEICTHADIPKPSGYRLVQELVAAGLLTTPGRGLFTLGARLKRITQSDLSDATLIEVIAPVLEGAATKHGAAFFLSRLRGERVEIIHVATPDNGVSYLHPGVGKRPLHACSCSKVIAAYLPELSSQPDLNGRLRKYTESTITSREDLEAEFEIIRNRGYAECIEELERGICSVATIISETGPGATFSIGATASARVLNPNAREEFGRILIAMSRDLSKSMNWDRLQSQLRAG